MNENLPDISTPAPTEGTTDTFDAATTAAALMGTWSYPAAEEPGGAGYLHFADKGRLFQVVHDTHNPALRTFMRLQFSVESPYALRIRSHGNPEGWICNYSFDGFALTLLPPGLMYSCARPAPEDIPEWFQGALAAGLAHE